MDKQTLSNYGWVVICILVLSVMIALATPFGSFIADGVKSTTQGLFDASQKAFNNVGLGQMADQSFEEHYEGNGTGGGSENQQPKVGSATFADGTILTWDELKLAENGTKYGYDASKITNTSIDEYAFYYCDTLTSIILPDGITSIGDHAFSCCSSLASIDLPDSITSIGEYAFRESTRWHHKYKRPYLL